MIKTFIKKIFCKHDFKLKENSNWYNRYPPWINQASFREFKYYCLLCGKKKTEIEVRYF